jgi:hypothetical protein
MVLAGNYGGATPQDPKKPSDTNGGATFSAPPAYLSDALIAAERLLKYAAETGINIDKDIRTSILQAGAASSKGWTRETADNLLAALTKLAAGVKPITAGSLKWSDENRQTRSTVTSTPAPSSTLRSKWKGRRPYRPYLLVTLILALIIIPFSVVSFVSTAISGAIQTDIKTANDLVVKLRAQLAPSSTSTAAPSSTSTAAPSSTSTAAPSSTSSPPPSALPPGLNQNDVITELQQFASSIRDIDGLAGQLNFLFLNSLQSLNIVRDPFAQIRGDPDKIRDKFELPHGLPDLAQAASGRITVYEEVRYFAQTLVNFVSVVFGAFTACILPVLYALFGTCAFLLRSYEQKAYDPPEDWARFLIAGIGGAVVGLFNNFSITQGPQGPSIPPLAIAFLVGYAVDVFFAFLENLLPKKK